MLILSTHIYLQGIYIFLGIYFLSKETKCVSGWHKLQQRLPADQNENHYTAVQYDLTYQAMISYNSITICYPCLKRNLIKYSLGNKTGGIMCKF